MCKDKTMSTKRTGITMNPQEEQATGNPNASVYAQIGKKIGILNLYLEVQGTNATGKKFWNRIVLPNSNLYAMPMSFGINETTGKPKLIPCPMTRQSGIGTTVPSIGAQIYEWFKDLLLENNGRLELPITENRRLVLHFVPLNEDGKASATNEDDIILLD